MRKILFLTVVYGTSPSETSTLLSLSAHDFLEFNISPNFAVWDNSATGFGFDSIPHLPGDIKYYHTGNNTPLSYIYNYVISEYPDVDWVVLLDDDSTIDTSYIVALHEFWNTDVPLAIPRIESSGVLISPGRLIGVHGKALANNEVQKSMLPSKGIAAMMSGTIIRRDVFNLGLVFDERLNFYGIDTRFFIDYSNYFSHIYLLNTTMNHSSALRDSGLSSDAMLRRLKNLLQSWPLVFDQVPYYRFRLVCYITLFIFKYVIKKRNLRFLQLFKVLPNVIFR